MESVEIKLSPISTNDLLTKQSPNMEENVSFEEKKPELEAGGDYLEATVAHGLSEFKTPMK